MRRLRICFFWFLLLLLLIIHMFSKGEEVVPKKRRKIAKYNFIFLDRLPRNEQATLFLLVFFWTPNRMEKNSRNGKSLISFFEFIRLPFLYISLAWYGTARLVCVKFTLSLAFFVLSAGYIYFLGFVSACCTYHTPHTNTPAHQRFVPKNISLSYHLKENKPSQMPRLRNNRKKAATTSDTIRCDK